jgi:hypothetical protein
LAKKNKLAGMRAINDLAAYTLVGILSFKLTYSFLGTPISEDMGFYGTISRFINMGYWPHRDIPLGTNTISFYINALIFKIFGSTPTIYKSIYIFYSVVLSFSLYSFCKNTFEVKKLISVITVITILV